MDVIVKTNEDDIAQEVASKILGVVRKKPNAILGLATGSSPLATYRHLAQLHEATGVSFKEVSTFNLDEYLGHVDEQRTYRFFMRENLFKYLDLSADNIHFPSAEKPELYDALIDQDGGIDLQLLGVGQNGHIAFNEPHTAFNSTTHIVTLDEKTRQDNARFFKSIDEVPTQAISMGLQTIMKAKKIIVLVMGDNKVDALKRLLHQQNDPAFPASVLNAHPNVTLYTTYDLFKKAIS